MVKKENKSSSWKVEESYVKLKGKWMYLYKAIDGSGNTLDFFFREDKNKEAAVEFFRKMLG
ncbi:DDE-type integrase/transposase/recombinase [Candidatus Cardinium hertigii]|uniref:DDE-type integrase/transposase/recombinase n=1 Tax=Candidatus Cardinium hertigii TaxID=247481 RepID=UPI003D7D1527